MNFKKENEDMANSNKKKQEKILTKDNKGRTFSIKNLIKRIVSSIILIPIVLYAIWYGSYPYLILILVIALLSIIEWMKLQYQILKQKEKKAKIWQVDGYVSGLLYVSFFVWSMLYLRDLKYGNVILFWLILTVWFTDIFAYFFGSLIGGPKLAPNISPKKTWSGFFGGILGAIFIAFQFYEAMSFYFDQTWLILLTISISVIAQIGDLMESYIKRKANVKDSGQLIPGHGGILDRVDSLLAASIFAAMAFNFLI